MAMPNQSSATSPLANPPHVRTESGNGMMQALDDQGPAGARRAADPSTLSHANPSPYTAYNGSSAASSNGSRTLTPAHSTNHGPTSPPVRFYAAEPPAQASAERLLAPSRARPPGRPAASDGGGGPGSSSNGQGRTPDMSAVSSRRTSWSSDAGSRDSRIYSPNPFSDSRTPSRAGSDDDNVNTQTVSEKYNILPSAGLLLFPEDVEKDDYLHNPDPNDKDRDCDICTRRGVVNIGGLFLILFGVLALFIAYPVITWVKSIQANKNPCALSDCLPVGKVPLLKNVRSGLIDPDTPSSAMTKMSTDGSTQLQLVFSDEFNTDGRSFYPGDDAYFTAVDIWYGVTQDLEWYDPDAATTKDGVLEIRFDAFQNHGLNYRSGMVQSWNQMCFTGGTLEASISLPGRGDTVGFWPGFWSMGNLGRPGYAASTTGMWPYSYDDICDAGITPNQSSTDGISYLPGMRLPACTCSGEDHPNAGTSRSAPEIDVLEGSVSSIDGKNKVGQVSQSCQLAPFDIWYYPDSNYLQIHDDTLTQMNSYTGGPFQQAISGLTYLNNDWYNGKAYQTYSFDYTPGTQGQITWTVGDANTWTLDHRAVRPNGNVGQRTIPTEPMAVVMNFGMSPSFSSLNWTGLGSTLPARMRFDYIRIYQDPNSQSVSCDPAGYPTTQYISEHPAAYQNNNLTSWEKTQYGWPRNALVNGCAAQDGSVPIRSS